MVITTRTHSNLIKTGSWSESPRDAKFPAVTRMGADLLNVHGDGSAYVPTLSAPITVIAIGNMMAKPSAMDSDRVDICGPNFNDVNHH